MVSSRLRALALVVVTLAALQLVYEEVLMFLGATGALPADFRDSPFVMVTIPLIIAVSLVVVLMGAAILKADTLR